MGTGPEKAQDQAARRRSPALADIERAAGAVRPVQSWNPPFLGDIDMRIAADGTWYYMGSPIQRDRMVRLFSTILRREEDGRFCLVTPVEKFGIVVDDAPFVAVELSVDGKGEDQVLEFGTNVGDRVTAGRDHPLRFARGDSAGETRPYVLVRDRLEALIGRSVFYELVDLGTTRTGEGEDMFGVWSGGEFFAMAPARDLDL